MADVPESSTAAPITAEGLREKRKGCAQACKDDLNCSEITTLLAKLSRHDQLHRTVSQIRTLANKYINTESAGYGSNAKANNQALKPLSEVQAEIHWRLKDKCDTLNKRLSVRPAQISRPIWGNWAGCTCYDTDNGPGKSLRSIQKISAPVYTLDEYRRRQASGAVASCQEDEKSGDPNIVSQSECTAYNVFCSRLNGEQSVDALMDLPDCSDVILAFSKVAPEGGNPIQTRVAIEDVEGDRSGTAFRSYGQEAAIERTVALFATDMRPPWWHICNHDKKVSKPWKAFKRLVEDPDWEEHGDTAEDDEEDYSNGPRYIVELDESSPAREGEEAVPVSIPSGSTGPLPVHDPEFDPHVKDPEEHCAEDGEGEEERPTASASFGHGVAILGSIPEEPEEPIVRHTPSSSLAAEASSPPLGLTVDSEWDAPAENILDDAQSTPVELASGGSRVTGTEVNADDTLAKRHSFSDISDDEDLRSWVDTLVGANLMD